MITIAIPIVVAVLWLWLAFCATVWCSFNCLMAALRGAFIRAAIWGCMAMAGIFWWRQANWLPDPWQFDKWLKGSASVVAFTMLVLGLGKLCAWRHQRRVAPPEIIPPDAPQPPVFSFTVEPQPPEADIYIPAPRP